MSNTATVSPYDNAQQANALEGAIAGAIVGGVVAAAAAIKWLNEETPEQRAALRKAREEDTELLVRQTLRLSSVALNLRDERTFAESAEALGFRPRAVAGSVLLLESAGGQRLAVTKSTGGKLVAHSNKGRSALDQVIFQHSLQQGKKQLKTLGMRIAERKTASGEVELIGVEQTDARGDGRAAVSVRVRRDGSLHIDVDGVSGSRCEQLVAGIASATGGEISQLNRKRSYFERPGESAKTKVRV